MAKATYEAIFTKLEEAKNDIVKTFEKGNATAGVRVRKVLKATKALIKQLIQESKAATK